jgi:hypothetical protein
MDFVLSLVIALGPYAYARLMMTYGSYLSLLTNLPRYFMVTVAVVIALSIAGVVCAWVLRRRAAAGKTDAERMAIICLVVRVGDCPAFCAVLIAIIGLLLTGVANALTLGLGLLYLALQATVWGILGTAAVEAADAEGYYSIEEEGAGTRGMLIPGLGLYRVVRFFRLVIDRMEGKTPKGRLPGGKKKD